MRYIEFLRIENRSNFEQTIGITETESILSALL